MDARSKSKSFQHRHHTRAFVLPHEAVVDVKEFEAVGTDGLLEEQRTHGGIHSA